MLNGWAVNEAEVNGARRIFSPDSTATVSVSASGEIYRRAMMDGAAAIAIQSPGALAIRVATAGAATVAISAPGDIYRGAYCEGAASVELQSPGILNIRVGIDGESAAVAVVSTGSVSTARSVSLNPRRATLELFASGRLVAQHLVRLEGVALVQVKASTTAYGKPPISSDMPAAVEFSVPAELRSLSVPAEPRQFDLPAQSRALLVESEGLREFTVPPEEDAAFTFEVPAESRAMLVPRSHRLLSVAAQSRSFALPGRRSRTFTVPKEDAAC